MADIRARNGKAVGMDRIGRVRHQHGITGPHGSERQVRQALLGANGDDGMLLRIEFDLVAAPVPVTDRLAQARNTARQRVAVGIAALSGLDQLVDYVLRCRLVRVAHTEIDDVLTTRPRRRLQLIDNIENIRGQPLDAGKFFYHAGNRLFPCL
jgi:hypothetical protein